VTNPNKETRQTDAIRPQFARQPAVAIRARTPQFDLVELDLYCVERLGGNRTVFRKKRKRFGALAFFIEDRKCFAPGRFLSVVDFAKV